jgi:hypothetical protein
MSRKQESADEVKKIVDALFPTGDYRSVDWLLRAAEECLLNAEDSETPETQQSEVKQSEVKQSEVKQFEVKQSEVKESDHQLSDQDLVERLASRGLTLKQLAYLLSVTREEGEVRGYMKEEIMIALGWSEEQWNPLDDATSTVEGSERILKQLASMGLRLSDLAPFFANPPSVSPAMPLARGIFLCFFVCACACV